VSDRFEEIEPVKIGMTNRFDEIEPMPDEEPIFQTSSADFIVNVEDGMKAILPLGMLILGIAALGFLNGLDYVSPQSGLVRPDEFIYAFAQSAPDGSAEFSGIVLRDGQPLEGVEVHVSMEDDSGFWVASWNYTDKDGRFHLTELNPGLTLVSISILGNGTSDVFQHRILLTPPSFLEPKGFTSMDFEAPSIDRFNQESCDDEAEECVRFIPHPEEELAHPRIDPAAGFTYVLVGWGFIGLSIFSAGFAIFGIKHKSRGMIRTAAILSFFTQGHYYLACLLGLLATVLTFTIGPQKKILQPQEI
tara:strand:- start:2755 stop:3666 length:912 start_codon:yes stop_codon:yes gene_type:complete